MPGLVSPFPRAVVICLLPGALIVQQNTDEYQQLSLQYFLYEYVLHEQEPVAKNDCVRLQFMRNVGICVLYSRLVS